MDLTIFLTLVVAASIAICFWPRDKKVQHREACDFDEDDVCHFCGRPAFTIDEENKKVCEICDSYL